MASPKPAEREPSAFDASLAPILDHLADELASRVARKLLLDAPGLTPAIPEVLTTEEAAKLLHVHPGTVTQFAAQGRVPAQRVGRRWLFRRTTLLQWLNGEYIHRSEVPQQAVKSD